MDTVTVSHYYPRVKKLCRGCTTYFPGKPLDRCSGCRIAFYCSKACQILDWPMHRTFCKLEKEWLEQGSPEQQEARDALRSFIFGHHRNLTIWTPYQCSYYSNPQIFDTDMIVINMRPEESSRYGCVPAGVYTVPLPPSLMRVLRDRRDQRGGENAAVKFVLPFEGGAVDEIHILDYTFGAQREDKKTMRSVDRHLHS